MHLLQRRPRLIPDRYLLRRELTANEHCRVVLAFDQRLARAVVVKVLCSDDPSVVKRFEREVAIVAQLNHPYIVPLLDAGTHEGRPYYVMPYMPGGSLRLRLKPGVGLPVETVLDDVSRLCEALEHASRVGIVHRDVKPENILVHDGLLLLVDFGIAAIRRDSRVLRATEALTLPGQGMGTLAYLSPEQILGEAPDTRCDIYALGLVMYEMLCGRSPFATCRNAWEWTNAHMQIAPAPLHTVAPGIPDQVSALVLRCLAKRPEDRYQTALELKAAVDAARVLIGRRQLVVGECVRKRLRWSLAIAPITYTGGTAPQALHVTTAIVNALSALPGAAVRRLDQNGTGPGGAASTILRGTLSAEEGCIRVRLELVSGEGRSPIVAWEVHGRLWDQNLGAVVAARCRDMLLAAASEGLLNTGDLALETNA